MFADARGQGCAIVYGDQYSAALEMTSNREKFQSKSSYDSELVNQNKLCMMGKWFSQLFEECVNRNLFQLYHEVTAGIIKSVWIPTDNNDADIGTKNLQGYKFKKFSERTFSRLADIEDDDK